jgi:hypothetical protein
VRAVPLLWELYPGICLTTEEKARINLGQGKKNLSQGTVYILPKHPHITKPTHIHRLNTRTHTHTHYKHTPTLHTHTHTHTTNTRPHYTHTHTTNTRPYINKTHKYTYTPLLTHKHTHTHTCTHSHPRTHTHTHTRPNINKTHTHTHYKKYKTTTVQIKTNTVQDTPKWNSNNIININKRTSCYLKCMRYVQTCDIYRQLTASVSSYAVSDV